MASKNFRVKLILKDLTSIRNLDVDNHCMPIRKREDGSIEMEALVGEATLATLRRRKKNVSVEVVADRAEEAAQTMKLSSRTNRYADGSLPVGPGSRKR
jgi:hypothetical protein